MIIIIVGWITTQLTSNPSSFIELKDAIHFGLSCKGMMYCNRYSSSLLLVSSLKLRITFSKSSSRNVVDMFSLGFLLNYFLLHITFEVIVELNVWASPKGFNHKPRMGYFVDTITSIVIIMPWNNLGISIFVPHNWYKFHSVHMVAKKISGISFLLDFVDFFTHWIKLKLILMFPWYIKNITI